MKYELTDESISLENGIKLYRIRSLKDFSNVKAGDLGGFIEKKSNLSQKGNCWVFNNALVYGKSKVFNGAQVYDDVQIYDKAQVFGKARIYNNAKIFGNSKVYDYARVNGNAQIYNHAWVYGSAKISDNSYVYGISQVYGYARIEGDVRVYGDARVYGMSIVYGNAHISSDAWPISPPYLNLLGNTAMSTSYSKFMIGYEEKTIEEWEKYEEMLAKSMNISKIELKLYKEILLFAKNYINLVQEQVYEQA